jgi:hypothetical protein
MRKGCKVRSRYEKLLQQVTKKIALNYPEIHEEGVQG